MFTTRLVPSCAGKVLVVAGRPAAGRPEGARPELAVVSQLAEFEAREDAAIGSVVFELSDAGDPDWLEPTLSRLAALGRSITLRSARVLPKRLVALAAENHCRIELQTAHHRVELQRALVRPDADSVQELLRHAQHLLAVGLTVTARVAPVVAGLHDAPGGIAPLFKAIAAANLHDVALRVGALSQPVVSALSSCMDGGTRVFWARAYGHALPEGSASPSRGAIWTLRSQTARALEQGLARLAQDEGLRVNGCGCTHACHLDGVSFGAEHPSPLLRSLFAELETDLAWEHAAVVTPQPSSRPDALVVDPVGNGQLVRTRHRRSEDRQSGQEEHRQELAGHQLVLLN